MTADDAKKTVTYYSVARVVSYTDAVFAIAATLLVLDLTTKTVGEVKSDAELWAALGGMWQTFLSFGISFALLSGLWVLHLRQFRDIARIDAVLLWINNARLLFVVLIPFTTSLVDEYSQFLAARILLPLNFFLAVLLGVATWAWAAARDAHLLRDDARTDAAQENAGGIAAVICGALAVILSPWLGSWAFTAYAFNGPLTALVRRLGRREAVILALEIRATGPYPRGMYTPDVRRWTGISAIAVAVFLGIEGTTKLTTGIRPELDESQALIDYTVATSTQTIIVILSDTFLMAFLIVFLACFRQLVTKARTDLQWIADITFGAGLVFVAVTLVGDAMDGGAALAVMGITPDASVIRGLILGHSIMFGSTGAVLLALTSATAAYLTFASRVVPRWTGVLAVATAGSNLAWAVVGLNGTSPNEFFAVGGAGNAILAIFPWLVWVFCVGITTVRGARPGTHKSGAPLARGATG